jgi:predicted secreted Zn-dependent protease
MGATLYKTSFRPFQVPGASGCKVTKLKVELGALVMLPRLSDESAVPAHLLFRWKSFIGGLREHEAGHVRIEYQHMREIEKVLVGSRCEDVQAKFQAARARTKALQQAYDRETEDGVKQGAILQ